jgi:glucose-1-phosphate thymidylyltransferase
VPAAGHAQRWRGQIGYSKELYPVQWPARPNSKIPVIGFLLDAFRVAGLDRALVVTRPSKIDIPTTLLDGKDFGCLLAYVIIDSTESVAHSLAAAMPFLEGSDVFLGYPDIVFEPHDAVRTMVDAWVGRDCDVLVGLFETDDPASTDTVEMDSRGRLSRVLVKEVSSLRYSWGMAVWRPRFSTFLRESLSTVDANELHVGHVLQRAIDSDLVVEGVPIPGGRYLDIGSPETAAKLDAFWSRSNQEGADQ